jgi:CelD/BcsL family acetyltransferase involved in cellulose biosynthesis
VTRPDAPSGELTGCLVRDEQDFAALAPEWTALAREAPAPSAAHTFPYAWDAWRLISRPRGGELHCIALRRGRQLVCVWPFEVLRKRGLRIAYPLGAGAHEEYGGPLLVEDADGDAVAARAFAEAKRLADAIRLYRLPAGGRMATVVEADRMPKHRTRIVCPVVSLSAFPEWDAWLELRSANFRQSLRRKRRRLGSVGDLRFERLENPVDVGRFVDWLFDRKSELVQELGAARSWVQRPETRAFFVSQITGRCEGGSVVALALELDGTAVAGCICLVSPSRMEYLVTGYDDARFGAFSPGHLLVEDCARWAIHRGLDLDLGIGEADYKLRWADRREEYTTYVVATSWAGCAEVAFAYLRTAREPLRARAAAWRHGRSPRHR